MMFSVFSSSTLDKFIKAILSQRHRMGLISFVLLVSLVFPTSQSFSGIPITRIGPGYANINNLAIHPNDPQVIYAATDAGILKSTDGGNTWADSSHGVLEPNAYQVVIAPSLSSTLYAVTRTGVYKSVDSGANWVSIQTEELAGSSTIAVSPTNPDLVYVGTRASTLCCGYFGNGVIKSVDGGASWVALENLGAIIALTIDPINPMILYANACWGRIECTLYKSTDGGDHWNSQATGLPENSLFDLAIDPSDSDILYSAHASEPGIFKSIDGGTNWITYSTGITASIYSLALDPQTPTNLYAGTQHGVFQTVNGGETWTLKGGASPCNTVKALAIDPLTPNNLYAGTQNGYYYDPYISNGLCKSTDSGDTWSPINSGLPNALSFTRKLKFDTQQPPNLFAMTIIGLYKTHNDGALWLPAFATLTGTVIQVTALAIHPTDPMIMYLGIFGQGVYASQDGGDHWTPINSGLTTSSVGILEINPHQPTTLYAGSNHQLFKSVDSGAHWELTYTDPSLFAVIHWIKIDPANANIIYLGIEGTFAAGRSGLVKTSNAGEDWEEIALPIPAESSALVQALVIHPHNPLVLYAGTGRLWGNGEEEDGAIYQSMDGGLSWALNNNGLPPDSIWSLVIDPSNPANLYAGTSQALFRTLTAGASWYPVNEYLDGGKVFDMLFAPNDTTHLYIGSERGVYMVENQVYKVYLPVVVH